jgi:hypothetical protein
MSPRHRGTICQETELVLEPAALLRLAPARQPVPVAVEFLLIVAEHHERDGVVERVSGPALMAMNGWPSSVNSTTATEPAGPLGYPPGVV